MKDFLKKLFCRHDYRLIKCMNASDEVHHEIYAKRIYKCAKCNKFIYTDRNGRKRKL